VALNLISSGMDKTSLAYAKAALQARVSFVNATPAKIATNASLAKKFAASKLVLAGDDLLSQFGGTAFHKGMIDFMVERGVHVKQSYQLDVGGSAETKNTMSEHIRMLKRGMKTRSIGMEAPYKFESVAGTTEYTDFLGDSRNSYYWMSSEGFLGSNIVMDLTLRTNDGSNAGNVLLDVVRAAAAKKVKAAKASEVISAFGFKSPPKQFKIREAYVNFLNAFA
jgi:myo-inositol-1-phosphate synthase